MARGVLAFLVAAFAAVVACAAATAVAVDSSAFEGYIVAAQYKCDDFLCPDWELDVSKVDTEWRALHLIQALEILVHKSPVAAMSFPVLTAFDPVSRVFFVAGTVEKSEGYAYIWGTQISDDVLNGTLISKTNVTFPSTSDVLTRIHAYNGSMLCVFKSGAVYYGNPYTGEFTPYTDLLAGTVYANGVVTAASVVADNKLVAFIFKQYDGNASVVVLDIPTKLKYYVELTMKTHEDWGLYTPFSMLYLEDQGKYIAFLTGTFDQILEVNITTGFVTPIIFNLADNMLAFTSDPNTKADDTLQTTAYDPKTGRIYFQATQFQGDDDIGTTTLQFITTKIPDPNAALSPYIFGTIGFFYVPIKQ